MWRKSFFCLVFLIQCRCYWAVSTHKNTTSAIIIRNGYKLQWLWNSTHSFFSLYRLRAKLYGLWHYGLGAGLERIRTNKWEQKQCAFAEWFHRLHKYVHKLLRTTTKRCIHLVATSVWKWMCDSQTGWECTWCTILKRQNSRLMPKLFQFIFMCTKSIRKITFLTEKQTIHLSPN